jgi:hypothetical protein
MLQIEAVKTCKHVFTHEKSSIFQDLQTPFLKIQRSEELIVMEN